MGSKSKKTKLEQTYITNNLNLQGVEGPALVGDENMQISSETYNLTDHDAMDKAGEISLKALESNNLATYSAIDAAEKVSIAAMVNMKGTAGDAFDFGEKAMVKLETGYGKAATFAQHAGDKALDFAFNATRSDAAINTETLIKYGSAAAAIVALTWVIAMAGGRKKA